MQLTRLKELSAAGCPVTLAPDADRLKAMLESADGANHVGEYPVGKYYTMPNSVGTIHYVADLRLILQLLADVEALSVEVSNLTERNYWLERTEKDYNSMVALLPNDATYLDPPDGGDVAPSEQMRRMIEDITDQRDALQTTLKPR